MSKVELKLLQETKSCTLYTIQFLTEDNDEFKRFYEKFKNSLLYNADFDVIIKFLRRIANLGALERFFRPEGKMNDNVCALPTAQSSLRLYCLRLSDKILILGNGGIKSSRTYNENPELAGYVMTLQKFDKLIKEGAEDGSIVITKNKIKVNKTFNL